MTIGELAIGSTFSHNDAGNTTRWTITSLNYKGDNEKVTVRDDNGRECWTYKSSIDFTHLSGETIAEQRPTVSPGYVEFSYKTFVNYPDDSLVSQYLTNMSMDGWEFISMDASERNVNIIMSRYRLD